VSARLVDTCQLWQVNLAECADPSQVLDATELERAARLRFARDRERFIAAHRALRKILGAVLDRDPAQIVFRHGEHGRPALADPAGLEFNMSHSGDFALIAVSAAGPLGVDVEVSREVARVADLARRYLHPEELRLIEAASPENRSRLFLTCWTRKEAVLKSTGVGLTRDTRALHVGVTAEDKVLQLPSFPQLRLASFSLAAGCVAACAAAADVRQFEFMRYAPHAKNCAP